MLVLRQDNCGFVDLDIVPSVRAFAYYSDGELRGRIVAESNNDSFWLGSYSSPERAGAVFMQIYEAKKAGVKDFVMPQDNHVCTNSDYCDI